MKKLLFSLFLFILLSGPVYSQTLTPEQEAGLRRLYYQVNQSWRYTVHDRPVEQIPSPAMNQVVNQNVVVNVAQPESKGSDSSYDPWNSGYVVWPTYSNRGHKVFRGRVVPCTRGRVVPCNKGRR